RPGERDLGIGTVFPHKMVKSKKGQALPFEWFWTPDSDRALADMGVYTLDNMDMGSDETPDLLFFSFGSLDYGGHAYGPFSLERVALLVALDRYLGELIDAIEKRAGSSVLIALTSDHGVAPTLPHAKKQGLHSERVDSRLLLEKLEKLLSEKLGEQKYFAAYHVPFLSFNPELSDELKAQALPITLEFLNQLPQVYAAWDAKNLASIKDPIARLMEENYVPDRAGEIAVVYKPYFARRSGYRGDLGSEHGTPWDYDRHVPVILYGDGIQAARINQPVQVIDLSRTIADRLGLPVDKRGGVPLP
ncbi:alkaline phosphatase family protein, partial [Myxococcota bacterium]|nr:alkaline phosphatase family protein [Myxococcota bacterium]